MKTAITRVALIASLAALTPVSVNAAFGADTKPSVTKIFQLDEIIVTAQKRTESAQSVPMSITAITAQDIEREGAMSFEDVASSVPSLGFTSNGPGRQQLSLRGISSGGAGVSSTVGYYLDEAAISSFSSSTSTSFQQVTLDPDLFDVERIEVLKGPQGTLYGSSSMGGTIKIVTKQPNLAETEARVNLQASGTERGGPNAVANAVINLPLIENALALRVVGSYRASGGFIDRRVGNFEDGGLINTPPADPTVAGSTQLSGVTLPARTGDGPIQVIKDINTEDVRSVRAALRWQPISALYVQPGVFFQRTSQGGADSVDTVPGLMDQRRPFNIKEPFNDSFTLSTMTVSLKLPAVTVLSASAFTSRSTHEAEDITDQQTFSFGYYNLNDSNFLPSQRILSPSGALVNLGDLFTNNLAPATVIPFPAEAYAHDSSHDFTEELRFSSRGQGPLRWTGGLFYKRLRTTGGHTYDLPGYTATFPLYAQLGQLVYGPGGWPWGDLLAANEQEQHLRESALFGELTYQLFKPLALTVGGRYYDYGYSFSRTEAGLFYGGGTTLTGVPITGDATGHGINPKVLLSYTWRRDSQVYVTAAKGFRIGAANSPLPTSRCASDLSAIGRMTAPDTYKPDSLWNYEVGSKNRLLDGRMTLDAALYDVEWKNVQERVSLPGCGFSYTDNVGNARSRGGELEIQVRPVRFLTMAGGVGYVDAIITAGAPGTGIVTGAHLIDVPKWTANAMAEATFRPVSGVNGFARLSWSYVDQRIDAYTEPLLPAYRIVNARVGVTMQRWEISLFGDNLLDEEPVFTRVATLGQIIPTYRRAVVGRPRTIGLSVSWDY